MTKSEDSLGQFPRSDAVASHLEVKCLEIRRENSGRFALVSTGRAERLPDRPPLSLGGGHAGHLPERKPGRQKRRDLDWTCLCAVRGQGQEMPGFDEIRAQEDGPANHVPELADVARPVIPEENLDGLVRDSAHRALELHRGLGQKSLRQVHDVLHTLPQRRSEEHTSELQSPCNLVCRLLLEKKKNVRLEPRAALT